MAEHGIILFAHGARAASWAQPFERLRDMVAGNHRDGPVRVAYLELMAPDLPSVVDGMVAEGVARIDLFPIFLAVGSHLREDLPALVEAARTRHPQLSIRVHPALGESEAMLRVIATGVAQSLADD
ncbi:MAG: cobalamin biosynthesis protein CbiX [Rhodocyclaceae bacterium]|nr:cobalamin biosynthesis protein CbiX [Rhodocyclaceae bacterium]